MKDRSIVFMMVLGVIAGISVLAALSVRIASMPTIDYHEVKTYRDDHRKVTCYTTRNGISCLPDIDAYEVHHD